MTGNPYLLTITSIGRCFVEAEEKLKRKHQSDVVYKREKTKSVRVRFYGTDMHVYDYLQTLDNIQRYIKDLVIVDMKAKGIPTEKGE